MSVTAPPHPRANPVVGSAIDLRRSQIHTYERVMREHGDVVRLVVGPPGLRFDLYCVFHPDGIGSHFAMLEAVIAVAVVLQRFRIRSDLEDVALETQGITLRPDGAVPIQLAARSAAA
jgi:hypothetical protein